MLRFWARRKLTKQPFPIAWQEILRTCLPVYRQLPAAERHSLEKHIRIFLAEKSFEGHGGLVVTEMMRVTIAGYACLLLLHDPAGYYPQLGTVVLYPRSFAAPIIGTDETGIVTETVEERLGESWQEGTVVLAWDAVEELIAGRSDDCNVIIHEFAHQIDARRGLSIGAGFSAATPRIGTGRRCWPPCSNASEGAGGGGVRRFSTPMPSPAGKSCSPWPAKPFSCGRSGSRSTTRNCMPNFGRFTRWTRWRGLSSIPLSRL